MLSFIIFHLFLVQNSLEIFDISLQGFLFICFVLFCLQANLAEKSLELSDLDFNIQKIIFKNQM